MVDAAFQTNVRYMCSIEPARRSLRTARQAVAFDCMSSGMLHTTPEDTLFAGHLDGLRHAMDSLACRMHERRLSGRTAGTAGRERRMQMSRCIFAEWF